MKLPFPGPRSIPPGRKAVYSLGMATSVVGLLMFLSTFISFASNFGDFGDFVGHSRSMMLRAFGGFVLMIVGVLVMGVGARGAFGSGMLLDPERAERDLEPWARMSGRLNDAAFSEMHAVRETIAEAVGGRRDAEPTTVAKVRCRSCQALCEEDARFCGRCGAKL